MPRRLEAERLVVASHNPGKVKEINALLAPFAISAVSTGDLGLPEPEETGDSFLANAELKARAAAAASGLPALADDSGLVVAALGGAPGIFSARWGGPSKDFAAAMARLERALGCISGGRARFVCVLALCWPDGHCKSFTGMVTGSLTFPPRGHRGFGYDPVFIADGRDITFGEMDPAEKDRISHRADAFAKLTSACLRG
ncbi:MAG TPA: RdgB/HAM1 family non-canonical purine NTP pyrophosphatase [Alphaproteobacteria bacterium]|jgi:XTP/dITP diphosphohydrolase|nr:RdgB/HAM1 family non-canonical purine NTP pyrophosphatase [Alphaproteobacteria bacterium]